MISISNLSVVFGGEPLFENISFLINRTDRIGLTGRNGAGKSTLLKIIKGLQKPTSGEVALPKGATIGYLPQEFSTLSSLSVKEETRTCFEEAISLEKKINQLNETLSIRTDYESQEYLKIIESLNEAQHRFQVLGGYEMDEKMERVLRGLGFEQDDMFRQVSEFSGGWIMRIELAKILLQQPDLIMLDEPTNHLDIEAIIWLESFLINYPGAILMISHDRTFLDKITNRTIEITNGRIEDYKASYSFYLVLRKERRDQLEATARNQEKEIARIERNIDRFRAKASKASFAQSLIKKLDRIERIEIDLEDVSSMHIRFSEPPRAGKVVLTADNLSKKFNQREVIHPMSFSIDRGDRIAFVGKNGMGKTTLSRILANDLDFDGELIKGHNVHLGYFAQHQANKLNGENTILKEMEESAFSTDKFTQVRSILGAFLFSGPDVEKKIKVLSGGEKARLSLAKLLLQPLNLLILDEPTNHLDIVSKEVLKNALLKFTGTLIIVSHDRDFLKGLTDKVFEFTPAGIKQHLGDISEFLAKRNTTTFRDIEMGKSNAKPLEKNSIPKVASPKNKSREKDIKKIQNSISNAEKKITAIETQLADMDATLQDSEKYKELINDSKFFAQYQESQQKLNEEMLEWEKLCDLLKQIQNKEEE
ncbi:MAG: ABC-F family ATP-binding cassette domain-containing protein [Candidatus Competibacteraceae bacterium]|nr:ABC-F family ATP-binding cassette domain-containing protein [Candidatus Competibacteraceae bacterium]